MQEQTLQAGDCDLALLQHRQAMGQRLHNLMLRCDASGLLALFLELGSSS
ncbi:hypothetical protein CLV01_4198 [Delftia sp. 60]|nr:hypothetical protein [Delftia sp. 60]PIF37037.1 hypothetical protein CLU98_2251 [Burkholderiales bacterium 23]PIF67781.1 hypothetical protein CLV01_4198 [Delftia sp. 60]